MKVLEAKTIFALNGDYMSANEVLSFKSKVMATAVNLSWLLTQYKLYLQTYGERQQNANVSFISFSSSTSFSDV